MEDPKTVINSFNGVSNLSRLFKKHLDIAVGVKSIQRWRERNTIPAKHQLNLMRLRAALEENTTT